MRCSQFSYHPSLMDYSIFDSLISIFFNLILFTDGSVKNFLKDTRMLRWSRELQLQKTHANGKSSSKLGKHLHQFGSTCAANTPNTAKYKTRKSLQLKKIKRHTSRTDHNKITSQTPPPPPPRKLTLFLRFDYHLILQMYKYYG